MQIELDKEVTVRKATISDATILFTWANDDDVRNNAIHTDKIKWEDHVNWLQKKLSSSSLLLILEVNKIPAGQIRFDFDDLEKAWFIDYSIGKNYRGQKLGKQIVSLGLKYLNQYPVTALVKPANTASIKVFEALNFKKLGGTTQKNVELVKFIKVNDSAACNKSQFL